MANNWLTSATLYGARDWSRAHRVNAQEDVGFKLEVAISAINTLNSAVSDLIAAAISAAASGVTWSAFSGATTSTATAISNFRAT